VTSIQGSRPAVANVSVYAADGSVLAAGPTDGQGMFRAGLPRDAKPAMVVADSGADVTASGFDEAWRYYVHHSCGGRSPVAPAAPRWMANIYTERPIYRPGQTVYVKAILRRDWDAQMSVPRPAVTVRLRDSRNYVLGESKLTASAFGTVDTRFDIAEGALAGRVSRRVVRRKRGLQASPQSGGIHQAGNRGTGEHRRHALRGRRTGDRHRRSPLPVRSAGRQPAGEPDRARLRRVELGLGNRRRGAPLDRPEHRRLRGKTGADGKWVVRVKAPYRSSYDDYWYYYSWYDIEAETVAFEATLEARPAR